MSEPKYESILEPDTLWVRVREQTDHALQCGALQPIATNYEFVEQDGIRFMVRILANLARKEKVTKQREAAAAAQGKEFNPFLPYEEDLFVVDLSETHLCLLNKFNVVDYHLLMVTRAFEEQDTWLTLPDFAAMWACLAQIDGLAFYNGGKAAGASQRHKHLQLVPLPLLPDGAPLPIEEAIAAAEFQNDVGVVPAFPFAHAVARFEFEGLESPLQAAAVSFDSYAKLLQATGLLKSGEPLIGKQSAPYNLLATRQWMLLVPRSQESYASIGVNSLGFAGGLLVRDEAQLQQLKACGPMTILQNVGCDRPVIPHLF